MTPTLPESLPPEPSRATSHQPLESHLAVARRHRLRMAGLVVVAVGLVTTVGLRAIQRLFNSPPAAVHLNASGPTASRERPRRMLTSGTRAKLSQRWQHLQADETKSEPAMDGRRTKVLGNKAALSARGGAVVDGAPPEDAYAALGGPVQEYQSTAHRRPTLARKGLPHRPAAVPSGRGTVLRVRLVDEAASQPIGGPWVARLEDTAQVGAVRLMRGTELHGITTSSTVGDHRLQMRVQFARLPDQTIQPITGWVRDLQGRPGMQAHRVMNGQSAENLGLTAVSRMAHQAGRLLAGQAGAVVGAGIEGATDAGTHKMDTWAADDAVLLLKRGSRMQVYVESVGLPVP